MLGKAWRAFGPAMLASGLCLAQGVPPPPRTLDDISALLSAHKPDAAALAEARAILARPRPENVGGEDLARYYVARISAAGRLGDQRTRLEAAREAGKLQFPSRWFVRVTEEWANAEEASGHFLESLRLRELVRSRTNASGARMAANGSLADTHAALGDLEAGRRLLQDSERVYRQIGGRSPLEVENEIALIERQRGDVLAREGKFQESAAAYLKAFNAADKDIALSAQRLAQGMNAPSADVIVGMRNNRGRKLVEAQLALGRVADAEYYARDVLRSALEWSGRAHPQTAFALGSLSRVMSAQGRFRDAEILAEASREVLAAAGVEGNSISVANTQGAIGTARLYQERWADALAAFEARREGLGGNAELERFLDGRSLEYGIALQRNGRHAEAVVLFERRERWWRDNFSSTHPSAATMKAFGALSHAALGDPARLASARRDLAEALPLLVAGERQAGDRAGSFESAARLRWLAEGALSLLSAQGGATAVAEAFEMADIARGSSVQRAMSASAARATVRDPALAALVREEQDAGNRIASLSGILIDILSRPADQQLPQVVAQMRKDLDALSAQRAAIRRRIAEKFPDYEELVNPKPATIAQARAALRPGEAMVALYLGEHRSYAWAFRNSGDAAFAELPVGANDIAKQVAQLRLALDVDESLLARIPAFDVDLAHRLYGAVLEPVRAGWEGASHLVLVPHGALAQLPFSVLVTAPHAVGTESLLFERYRGVPWLMRVAAISQMPSVSAFVTQRSLPPPAEGRRSFVGFGDPKFSPQAAAAGASRGIRMRNLSLATRDAQGRPVAHNEIARLAPLPDTADEIHEMADLMKADVQSDVFLGLQASETRVKQADLSKVKILAFATHGLVPGDLDGLSEPALALSNPSLTGEKESDGLLGMNEILSLKLDADWVVLSACNTAAGDGAAAEAVSGLGRAFFYAGARALLVSNWPVETVSARMLTTGIFRKQAANPALPRSQALRGSMLDMVRDGLGRDASGQASFSYAHPLFWAPFSLIGDGG